MNILPKKRWHVRNWDNILRVKKDEKKAREEEQEVKRRADLADREARLNNLRKRAADEREKDGAFDVKKSSKDSPPLVSLEDSSGHINLFAAAEAATSSAAAAGTNLEHEKEKKAEKEQHELKLGILKYLGGGERTGVVKETPWYEKTDQPAPRPNAVASNKLPTFLVQQEKIKTKEVEKSHKKQKKAHKHKKKKRKRKSSESSVEILETRNRSLEQLRAERLEREKTERRRAEAILNQRHGIKPEESSAKPEPPVQKYNSQFNPQFARQNR